MPRRSERKRTKQVSDYEHTEATRLNNPPAGLAWQDTEKPPKRRFEYDPHLDPQLVWAGKAERTSFEVEAPSIHVHERLSTEAILRAVQKEPPQPALFGDEEMDRSKAVEFYRHEQGWVNRLILGDSMVVMTSLKEKERLSGQVQTIYVDPPYGIGYNSNFQPHLSNRMVKDGKDEHLTREPEQIQAFRDTWQLGIHSYLTYLRDRLLLCHELLAENGSIFVQIGEDNLHLARALLDEVFGRENFCSVIAFRTKIPLRTTLLPGLYDYILWYAKVKTRAPEKFRRLFVRRQVGEGTPFTWVELPKGERRRMNEEERRNPTLLPSGARAFRVDNLLSAGRTESCVFDFELDGQTYSPGGNKSWKTNPEGMKRLIEKRRVMVTGNTPGFVFFANDYPVQELSNVWSDTQGAAKPVYVVQTSTKIVERCILMTTDPGDLVLDPMVGSGTVAYVAEQWGRRWIGIDTSRVAISLARERLLTGLYPYYKLVDDERGVDGGLVYRSVPHVTLGALAQNKTFGRETLVDQPETDTSKVRVSGPFTVEALSRYSINPLQEEVPPEPEGPQAAEAQDHVEILLDALRKQGIPRNGKPIKIESLQRIASAGAIQAEGTYLANGKEKSFAVSLGPRFGPVTVAQIDEALHDAYGYDLVVFAGFAATAEAQTYVAKGKLGKFEVALLAANPDLLVGDLLKSTPSSQTFRLFSAPDAEVVGEKDGNVRVSIIGVDSYDAATGKVTSGGQKDIAAWFLDQDYDGLVFHVNQAFFPRTNSWEALQRALTGTIEPELMEQLESFESLPFGPGQQKKVAIRVVTDDGNVSEAVLDL
jgi:adenine-specific DNA-methyltransferase